MGGKGFGSDSAGPKKGSGGSSKGAGRGRHAFEEQMRSFNALKAAAAAGGDATVNDVYVHADGDEKFYFAGKVARRGGLTVDQAIRWHAILIADHACMLEPSLATKGGLQYFHAPGDSEIACAKYEHDLVRAVTSRAACDVEGMISSDVGFMPETYEPGAPVYYTRRAPDGTCLGPPLKVNIQAPPPM